MRHARLPHVSRATEPDNIWMLASVADVRGTSIVAGVIEVRSNEAMPSPEVAGGGLSLRHNAPRLGVESGATSTGRRPN
eukprot:3595339-Prymnesium_polylepis.1